MPSDAAPPADLNAAIAEDVRHDTQPPDPVPVASIPAMLADHDRRRTLRRLTDAEVSRLYRLWLDVETRAGEGFERGAVPALVLRQTRKAFCRAHTLAPDQLRSIERRGHNLLHAAAIADAAVSTSQQTPQGALRDAESVPSTRETRSAAPDVSTKGAGVSASPRPAIGDGTRLLLGGRVGALAKMLDQLTTDERTQLARRAMGLEPSSLRDATDRMVGSLRPNERAVLAQRFGFAEVGDDAAGASAIATADDLREAAETTRAQQRLQSLVQVVDMELDAYRATSDARRAITTALPMVRSLANAIPSPYAEERRKIVSALDLLREVLAALGVL